MTVDEDTAWDTLHNVQTTFLLVILLLHEHPASSPYDVTLQHTDYTPV